MDLGVSKELYRVMDALAALKIDLECEPTSPAKCWCCQRPDRAMRAPRRSARWLR
jgi:hypothetical protein